MTEEDTGRLLKKAVSAAAGETKPEAYPLGYVEDFVEPRTKLAAFWGRPAKRFSDTASNAPPTHPQSQETHYRDCLCH